MSGIRSWVAVLFFVRSFKAVSGFRSWLLWKTILEPQDVAGGLALVGAGIMAAARGGSGAVPRAGEVFVQRRDRHFRIVRQPACVGKQPKSGLCRSQRNQSTILVAGFSPRCWMAQTVALWLMVPASAGQGRWRGEAMIGQRAQRIVETADQRPAEALRQHGIAERLLLRAQPPLRCLQFEEQDAPIADHHQIGETGMDAHADQDRLALGPAGTGSVTSLAQWWMMAVRGRATRSACTTARCRSASGVPRRIIARPSPDLRAGRAHRPPRIDDHQQALGVLPLGRSLAMLTSTLQASRIRRSL
jgi:hypothetical protein